MTDAAEHRGALLKRALDALFHLDKGIARLPHFARAVRAELKITSFAKILRRARQSQDRPDLVAQKRNRYAEQHQRRDHHPDEENMRVGRIGGAAIGDNAQHASLRLHAHFHELRATDGVNPERATQLARQFARQGAVEQCEKRLGQSGRQRLAAKQFNAEAPTVFCNILDSGHRGARFNKVYRGADVRHHGGRKPLRDKLPMPLHEKIRDGRLQQHHRHNNDEQRARVKSLGHALAQRNHGAAPERANLVERGRERNLPHRSTTRR